MSEEGEVKFYSKSNIDVNRISTSVYRDLLKWLEREENREQ